MANEKDNQDETVQVGDEPSKPFKPSLDFFLTEELEAEVQLRRDAAYKAKQDAFPPQ